MLSGAAGRRIRQFVVFGFHVWLGFGYVSAFNGHPAAAIFGLVAYGAGLVVAITVHEVGHAIAASFAGWRCVLVSILWCHWRVPYRNVVFSKWIQTGDALGKVIAVPSNPSFATPVRAAIFIAGGPMANLLFAAALLILSGAWTDWLSSYDRLCQVVAAYSIFFALVTVIPVSAARRNDGDKLLSVARQGANADFLNPLGWIAALLTIKVRLRDIPEWIYREAHSHVGNSVDLAKHLSALDVGRTLDIVPVDAALARLQIDSFVRTFGYSDWQRACDAFLSVVYEHDADRAHAALCAIRQPSEEPALELAARAALSMFHGNDAEAHALLDQMDAIVQQKSRYRDETFLDIRSRVENVAANLA
jgi:hypothetical protein